MQEIHLKNGDTISELFGGKTDKEVMRKMDKRLNEVKAEHGEPERVVRRKIGRNEPCVCGSGIKFKKCCINKVR